jgi:uncharacterized membrane protein
VVGAGDDGGSLQSSMALVLLIGALSFTIFIIGHMMISMRITHLEQRLEHAQKRLDGGN